MTDSFYITLSALGIPALAAIIYCIKGEIDIRKDRKELQELKHKKTTCAV